jgi:hypothetical protein
MSSNDMMETGPLIARAAIQSSLDILSDWRGTDGSTEGLSDALRGVAQLLKWLSQATNEDVQVDINRGARRSLFAYLPSTVMSEYISLTSALQEVSEGLATTELHDATGSVAELLDRTEKLFRLMHNYLPDNADKESVQERLISLLSLQSSFRLANRAAGAVAKAEEAADSAAESAGGLSEIELSTEFDQLAKREGRTANRFRGFTIFLFLIVIAYAAAVALAARTPSVEVGQKLAVGIPVLLLAGYFSREASHHRKTARWASILGAQLRSVRAYTVSMGAEAAESLRLDLGKRAFLETPDTQPSKDEGSTAATPVDAGLVREITDLVRASRQP